MPYHFVNPHCSSEERSILYWLEPLRGFEPGAEFKLLNVSIEIIKCSLTYSISDHQPYFISLYKLISHSESTKLIYIKKVDPFSLLKFKIDLSKVNVYEKINYDKTVNPNNNYNIIDKLISTNIDKNITTKTVRYDKHKHNKIKLDHSKNHSFNLI